MQQLDLSGYYQVHQALFYWSRKVKCPEPTGESLIHDIRTTLIPCRLKRITCHTFMPLLWILGKLMDPQSVDECWMNGRVDGCWGSGRPAEAMVMGARCVVKFVLPVGSP